MRKKVKTILTGMLILVLGLMVSVQVRGEEKDFKTHVDAEKVQAVSVEQLKIGNLLVPIADNYVFTEKMEGKFVKVIPQIDGTLCIWQNSAKLYDSNKKEIGLPKSEWGDCSYIKGVKKGSVYYLKIAENFYKECHRNASIEAYVYPDNVLKMKNRRTYVQSATGKYHYKYFELNERTRSSLSVYPAYMDYKTHTYFYIQRKEKNGWKNIISRQTAQADEHGNQGGIFGLKKGQYRIAFKSAPVTKYKDDQFTILYMKNSNFKANYQTRKSKAQKIKLKTTKTNIYTPTEKASRWYRVYRKTANYKRYVKMSVKNNSGKMKFSIYKKGRTKAVKTYTLSGNTSKTYRLKNGKGTYYVKVSKSGSKMNGHYSIQYK